MTALGISFLEGIVVQNVFPDLDLYHLIGENIISHAVIALGIVMMISGHYFRISAEMTAGRNFNHQI